jgi:hypothetical protein
VPADRGLNVGQPRQKVAGGQIIRFAHRASSQKSVRGCRGLDRSIDLGVSDATRRRQIRKDETMRFMLLQNYGEVESDCAPMSEWTPADIKAHIDFQRALNDELAELGELVDAQGLAGPDQAKFVVSDGSSAPVITDGPFPESKELLAGYRLIDVETLERAIEIAAKASAAPAQNGAPIRQPIEVRQVLSAPDPEM